MSEAPDIREQEDCPSGEVCEWACDQHERHPMTLTTKDAETLAEALWRHKIARPADEPITWCVCLTWSITRGDYDSDERAHNAHVAQALIASGAVRREAEVRAEALREAAEVLGDHRTLPELDDKPVFAVMRWLRLRAALAEEGDRG